MKVMDASGQETRMTWEHVEKVIKDNFSDFSLLENMAINGSETAEELIAEYQYQMSE